MGSLRYTKTAKDCDIRQDSLCLMTACYAKRLLFYYFIADYNNITRKSIRDKILLCLSKQDSRETENIIFYLTKTLNSYLNAGTN
jgi:hypothetical protein